MYHSHTQCLGFTASEIPLDTDLNQKPDTETNLKLSMVSRPPTLRDTSYMTLH